MKNAKKEIEEELEKLAPSLSKLKKEEHFEVPKDYFQQLPDQIFKQLDLGKNHSAVEVAPRRSWLDDLTERLSFLFQPRVGIAFGAVLILLASIFLLNQNTAEVGVDSPNIASLTTDEMEQYLSDNIDEFEEETFYDLADEIAIVELEEVNEEELDDYLDEIIDDIDESELEDLL